MIEGEERTIGPAVQGAQNRYSIKLENESVKNKAKLGPVSRARVGAVGPERPQ